jgi:hypothetical protein
MVLRQLVIRGLAIAVATGLGSACALAQAATPNTISCDGFHQLQRGAWYAKSDNPLFDLGSMQGVKVRDRTILPGQMNVGGHDLAAALDTKCRGPNG